MCDAMAWGTNTHHQPNSTEGMLTPRLGRLVRTTPGIPPWAREALSQALIQAGVMPYVALPVLYPDGTYLHEASTEGISEGQPPLDSAVLLWEAADAEYEQLLEARARFEQVAKRHRKSQGPQPVPSGQIGSTVIANVKKQSWQTRAASKGPAEDRDE